MSLVSVSRKLSARVSRLKFGPPVTHIYNPLEYARAPHERYLERYGTPPKEVVLVGMNPGPFGMAQTGVPFGDVQMVRDWMEGRFEDLVRNVEAWYKAFQVVPGDKLYLKPEDRVGIW